MYEIKKNENKLKNDAIIQIFLLITFSSSDGACLV